VIICFEGLIKIVCLDCY